MASAALDGMKNNIGNYKGVMLCTRPNESIGQPKDKPFISRVDPKEQVGLNPARKMRVRTIQKKYNPILARHREWLEQFKIKIKQKKEEEQYKEEAAQQKFDRIKGNAVAGRTKNRDDRDEYSGLNKSMDYREEVQKAEKKNEFQHEPKPLKSSLKKKDKPKWAMTEQQLKDEEENEVDQLLDFTNTLDYEKYIHDLEVKNMLAALKNRIDDLQKDETDWKNKIVNAWNNEEDDIRALLKPNKVDLGNDARSESGRSVTSEAKSVASERSQKSIQDLKTKLEKNKEKKDWDNVSTASKKQQNTLEERIAKHVADEILRNNTQFRHVHSNNSVRKLLEREAKKHLEGIKGITEPKIVENKDHLLRNNYNDPNTLPYLHRNPAI